jgi:hypothetical protein
MAAAAMRQPGQLASILGRIAANEDRLRYWALQINGVTGALMLKGRVFPFAGVVDSAPVTDARVGLDTAYARERDAARGVLSGLP